MVKTKYEIKLEKKQAKRLKREQKREARKAKRKARRLARREKREQRRFERKSDAKYRVWHRAIIKLLRVGGPISAVLYIGWRLSKVFTLETPEVVGKLNLDNAVMLMFFGSVAFAFALWFGLKWLKNAITATANAANQGIPSFRYNPAVITMVRAILSTWFFALMWGFNYIGLHYGEALNNGMGYMIWAFCIGFGSVLAGDIIEQRILKRVRNQKHEAEDEDRLMTRALFDKMNKEVTE